VNYYVVKYKEPFFNMNYFVVGDHFPIHEVNIFGTYGLVSEAKRDAERLNKALILERQGVSTLTDSLSNDEPLRPLKNDSMEIDDVKN